MSDQPFRVGIIGLQPGRSWAAKSHLPALRSMPDSFEVVGVANSSLESSEAAAAATGVPRAFLSAARLVASTDIDVVVVTVKVPHHLELVTMALEAGKHVYCEWPLGNGLAEAQELALRAKEAGVVAVAGMQARVAPEVMFLNHLVEGGFFGEILSTTITAWGNGWGADIESEKLHSYNLDLCNGATMLTIPIGHTLAAVKEVLGGFAHVSAVLENRRHHATALDTGNVLPMTSHDQVLMSGVLESGAPVALHYRGGRPRYTPGMVWEINGTAGDARVTGPFGHAQISPLGLEVATGNDTSFRSVETPASFREGIESVVFGNVARVYARMAADLRDGTRTAPSFDDAVELHRVLDAIETSAARGERVTLSS